MDKPEFLALLERHRTDAEDQVRKAMQALRGKGAHATYVQLFIELATLSTALREVTRIESDHRRDALEGRISKLDRRLKQLENVPVLRFVGAWRRENGLYSKGQLATHNGQAWFCVRDTDQEPGESAYWRPALVREVQGTRQT